MKRLMTILFAIGMITMSNTAMAAMSKSRVRTEARFLTDKMAYELSLNVGQRNDVYEINHDFIYSVRYLMDDVLRGEEWAMDRYYHLLDLRNDDLRWVMDYAQYQRFALVDYFYRPIYTSGSRWSFRIHIAYTNHNFFYFDRPHHYSTYVCRNYRTNHSTPSYYHGRYNHTVYSRPNSVRNSNVYDNHRRSDFSSVKIRPNTSTSPRVSENNRNSRPNINNSSRTNTYNSSRTNASSGSRTSTYNSSRANASSGSRTTTTDRERVPTVTNSVDKRNNQSARNTSTTTATKTERTPVSTSSSRASGSASSSRSTSSSRTSGAVSSSRSTDSNRVSGVSNSSSRSSSESRGSSVNSTSVRSNSKSATTTRSGSDSGTSRRTVSNRNASRQ